MHRSEKIIQPCNRKRGEIWISPRVRLEGELEILKSDGGGSEVDLDEQQHRVAGEEEEEDHLAGARDRAVPPGRRSTGGSSGNTTTAPSAELTSSTVPLREWSVARSRRNRGRRGGISRSGILTGKKRARKFPLLARARHSSRRRQRFARSRAARARSRRNGGGGRAARAKRERGENGRRRPGFQLGLRNQTWGNDSAEPGRPILTHILTHIKHAHSLTVELIWIRITRWFQNFAAGHQLHSVIVVTIRYAKRDDHSFLFSQSKCTS
jgi:hypothetical protein